MSNAERYAREQATLRLMWHETQKASAAMVEFMHRRESEQLIADVERWLASDEVSE